MMGLYPLSQPAGGVSAFLPRQGMSVIEVAELANKKGSHTKIIEFLKSDLETWLSAGSGSRSSHNIFTLEIGGSFHLELVSKHRIS